MNDYIMDTIKQIREKLTPEEALSSECIDSMIGALEMMKMEIEQHITNMPQTQNYQNLRIAAQNAMQNLSKVLDLMEELLDGYGYNERVCEILDILDEISY